MEPSMNDMDDYNKPLSKKKRNIIIGAFAILIAIYAIYALTMGSL
jgi:hypothetical protein